MWPAFNPETGCERRTHAHHSSDQGQPKLFVKAYLNKQMCMPGNCARFTDGNTDEKCEI
jgi:hypothetical protein